MAEQVVLDQLQPVGERIERWEEGVDEPVGEPVDELGGASRRPIPIVVPPIELVDSGRRVVPERDDETLRHVRVNLDEAVLVGRVAVEHEEDGLAVVVELRPLPELQRVLDRERMETERLADHRHVLGRRPRTSSQKKPLATSRSSAARVSWKSLAPEAPTTRQSAVDRPALTGRR